MCSISYRMWKCNDQISRISIIPACRIEMHMLAYMQEVRSEMQTIQTKRLTIRPIAAEDWRSIQEIWLNFQSSAFAQYDIPHSTDEKIVRAKIAKWAAVSSTDHLFFAVCLNDTVIGYSAFHKRENAYELGYCFHSTYHGKGYAKESHLALFDFLRTLGITRLTAGTALNNTPSVALLHSLGFSLLGTEKVSFYKNSDGQNIVFDGGIFERTL